MSLLLPLPYVATGGGGTPAFIGTHTSGQTGSNTTTHTMNMGSLGHQVGERIIVDFSVDGSPTITIDTGFSGSNWARLGQYSSGAQTFDVFTKIAEGSDVLRVTTSVSEQSGHICQRIENAANIEFATPANSGGAQQTNANPPSLSPAPGSREYLWLAIMGAEVGCSISAAPTNYGGLIAETGSGTSGSVAMAYRLLTAGTEDPGTFTSSSSRWGAVTAAIWS